MAEDIESNEQKAQTTNTSEPPKYDTLRQRPNGYTAPKKRLEPIARILLMGVYDDTHILSTFRGMRYLVQAIWEYTIQFNKHYWYKYIHYELDNQEEDIYEPESSQKYLMLVSSIEFPSPKGININMMPFYMSYEFKHTFLPRYLKQYFEKLIKPCLRNDRSQQNTICYLTIKESIVDKDKTQRRPGLHVESPGKILITPDDPDDFEEEMILMESDRKGGGKCEQEEYYQGGWGGGMRTRTNCYDGIYMASNVGETCAVWDCKVGRDREDEDGVDRDVIGHLGDIEHLRGCLPEDKKMLMKGNRLYWITDRTPHEALPMRETGKRQFFRLVSNAVNVWYEEHSTPNPNGLMPDEGRVKIIKGSKFGEKGKRQGNKKGCVLL